MVTGRGSQLWHNTLLVVFLVTGSRTAWLLAVVLDLAGGLGEGTYWMKDALLRSCVPLSSYKLVPALIWEERDSLLRSSPWGQ